MEDDEQIINNEEVIQPDESQNTEEVELANPSSEQSGEVSTEEPQGTTDEEAPDESEQEEEKPPSRREQLRIQQLLKKYGDPQQGHAQQPPKSSSEMDYSKELNADEELIKQLEADRNATAQRSYEEGLKRADFIEWNTSLRIDAPIVAQKYPILDKNSTEFHPAIADAVNMWYLRMTGYDANSRTVKDPSISYADFVDSYMELVEETAAQKNLKTVKNVAKQAAATGLRPDGSSAKRLNLNQAPEKMSIEELYAAIGQKPPQHK
ncbi:MAG: hypothetical protein KDH96_08935 [Candidatus Riesia sp.]|nr:hypothetical protein [Candidatus Riesia sp.]